MKGTPKLGIRAPTGRAAWAIQGCDHVPRVLKTGKPLLATVRSRCDSTRVQRSSHCWLRSWRKGGEPRSAGGGPWEPSRGLGGGGPSSGEGPRGARLACSRRLWRNRAKGASRDGPKQRKPRSQRGHVFGGPPRLLRRFVSICGANGACPRGDGCAGSQGKASCFTGWRPNRCLALAHGPACGKRPPGGGHGQGGVLEVHMTFEVPCGKLSDPPWSPRKRAG